LGVRIPADQQCHEEKIPKDVGLHVELPFLVVISATTHPNVMRATGAGLTPVPF
jgi:hypothetical protein